MRSGQMWPGGAECEASGADLLLESREAYCTQISTTSWRDENFARRWSPAAAHHAHHTRHYRLLPNSVKPPLNRQRTNHSIRQGFHRIRQISKS